TTTASCVAIASTVSPRFGQPRRPSHPSTASNSETRPLDINDNINDNAYTAPLELERQFLANPQYGVVHSTATVLSARASSGPVPGVKRHGPPDVRLDLFRCCAARGLSMFVAPEVVIADGDVSRWPRCRTAVGSLGRTGPRGRSPPPPRCP